MANDTAGAEKELERSAPHSARNVIDEVGSACVRAEARLLDGHHAIGEMLAAQTAEERGEIVLRFLKIANELTRRLNWLETLPYDDEQITGWLEPMLLRVRQHPLSEWLRSPPDPEAARIARGSLPPFAEIAADHPPIGMCASFLDEVAKVLAHARREAERT